MKHFKSTERGKNSRSIIKSVASKIVRKLVWCYYSQFTYCKSHRYIWDVPTVLVNTYVIWEQLWGFCCVYVSECVWMCFRKEQHIFIFIIQNQRLRINESMHDSYIIVGLSPAFLRLSSCHKSIHCKCLIEKNRWHNISWNALSHLDNIWGSTKLLIERNGIILKQNIHFVSGWHNAIFLRALQRFDDREYGIKSNPSMKNA